MKAKWRRRDNGETFAKVNIEFRVNRERVVCVVHDMLTSLRYNSDATKLTKKAVWKNVRFLHWNYGEDWFDYYTERSNVHDAMRLLSKSFDDDLDNMRTNTFDSSLCDVAEDWVKAGKWVDSYFADFKEGS